MTNHAAWACESAARTYLGLEPGELVRRGSLGRRSAASHRSCSFVSCPLSEFAGVQMLLLISPPPHPLTGHRHTTATEPTRDTHAERGQQQGLEQSTCRGGSFRFGCAESNRLRVRALPRNHRREAVIAAQAAQVQCRRRRPRGCGRWRRRRRFCRECRRPPTRSRSEFAE